MQFKPVNEPYTYGYIARNGKYHVELLRGYPGQWHVFKYESGLMLTGKDSTYLFQTAKRVAREWLASVQS